MPTRPDVAIRRLLARIARQQYTIDVLEALPPPSDTAHARWERGMKLDRARARLGLLKTDLECLYAESSATRAAKLRAHDLAIEKLLARI